MHFAWEFLTHKSQKYEKEGKICYVKLVGLFSHLTIQRAKKVVSDSPGLVDFAIRLDNSVFDLPDGQVMFFEEFE